MKFCHTPASPRLPSHRDGDVTLIPICCRLISELPCQLDEQNKTKICPTQCRLFRRVQEASCPIILTPKTGVSTPLLNSLVWPITHTQADVLQKKSNSNCYALPTKKGSNLLPTASRCRKYVQFVKRKK